MSQSRTIRRSRVRNGHTWVDNFPEAAILQRLQRARAKAISFGFHGEHNTTRDVMETMEWHWRANRVSK